MQMFCYNAMQCPVVGVWELGIKNGTTCCGLVRFWFHKCAGHLLLFGQWNCHVEGLKQVTCAVIVTAD